MAMVPIEVAAKLLAKGYTWDQMDRWNAAELELRIARLDQPFRTRMDEAYDAMRAQLMQQWDMSAPRDVQGLTSGFANQLSEQNLRAAAMQLEQMQQSRRPGSIWELNHLQGGMQPVHPVFRVEQIQGFRTSTSTSNIEDVDRPSTSTALPRDTATGRLTSQRYGGRIRFTSNNEWTIIQPDDDDE